MNDWEKQQLLDSQKDKFRQSARQKRDAIPEEKRAQESKALFDIVTQTELYENAKWILCYVSIGSEVDTRELIRKALKDDKRVYIPRTRKSEKLPGSNDISLPPRMDFFRIEEDSRLEPGQGGVLEPQEDPSRIFPYDLHLSLDKAEECVFFVPGLAFDKTCHRIGYGKGYYDRYLSRFDKKMTVGLAFTEQIADSIPTGDNDIALDLVVTPQGAFY